MKLVLALAGAACGRVGFGAAGDASPGNAAIVGQGHGSVPNSGPVCSSTVSLLPTR